MTEAGKGLPLAWVNFPSTYAYMDVLRALGSAFKVAQMFQ